MNTKEYFRMELESLRDASDGKLLIEPYVDAINEIIDIFSSEGHSGASAPFAYNCIANTIKRALSFKPLSPIQNVDSEWVNVSDCGGTDGRTIYQNKRLSSLFKDDNKHPYYLNAIVWKSEDGCCFTGTVDGIKSRQEPLKFPFTPETFYIDVKKVYEDNPTNKDNYFEDNNGFYKEIIVDKSQLEKVKVLYNLK